MEPADVKFEETNDIKIYRVVRYFGFTAESKYGNKIIYAVGATRRKYSFLGISFSRPASKKLLGTLESINNNFEVYNRANLSMAAIFVKKLSLELNKEILIVLDKEDGELVEINGNDPAWLNIRL